MSVYWVAAESLALTMPEMRVVVGLCPYGWSPHASSVYTIYNTDLIDLPNNPEAEDALGYVDNIALIATSSNLTETTNQWNIMSKARGGLK